MNVLKSWNFVIHEPQIVLFVKTSPQIHFQHSWCLRYCSKLINTHVINDFISNQQIRCYSCVRGTSIFKQNGSFVTCIYYSSKWSHKFVSNHSVIERIESEEFDVILGVHLYVFMQYTVIMTFDITLRCKIGSQYTDWQFYTIFVCVVQSMFYSYIRVLYISVGFLAYWLHHLKFDGKENLVS